MRVLIVIVCYRSVELTLDCLRSLAPQIEDVPGVRVGICENGSGGDAERQLRDAIEANGWSSWAYVSAIHPNRGFAGGNNVIIREALESNDKPDYLLLLNSDTIVRPGALAAMVRTADARPDVGVLGPKLEWPDGTPQTSCFRYHSPVSELMAAARTGPISDLLDAYRVAIPHADSPIQPPWTTFACAMIRREVFEKVGVLDEGYYLYFDDIDFCRRSRDAGWIVLHDPTARVVHLRGQSNPVKSLTAQRKRRPNYYYASRARYFAKFYGRPGLWLANLMWLIGRGVSLMRELVGRKPPHICEREAADIWTNWRNPLAARRYQQAD